MLKNRNGSPVQEGPQATDFPFGHDEEFDNGVSLSRPVVSLTSLLDLPYFGAFSKLELKLLRRVATPLANCVFEDSVAGKVQHHERVTTHRILSGSSCGALCRSPIF
jgi:hypothetical protein